MVNRVSTASFQNTNLKDIGLVQADLAKLNQQISSGNKATTYQELNGVVERVSGYNTKLSSIDNYTTTNVTVSSNLSSMDSALGTIQTAASSFSSLLASNKNTATGNPSTFVQQAQSILNQITASLNSTNSSGDYLFSGSKSNTAPVASPMAGITTPGTADNNYYQGDSSPQTVRISDTQTVNYGVTAGDPAFQNLIGSIQTAISAFQHGTPSASLLSSATDMLNKSVSGIAALQATVGVNEATVNTANDTAATIKTYVQQSLSDDTSTDIAEASIQLSTDQTVLQATFQAFASISKLKLTDYLN